ncbi:hypothetical protein F4777DRAFT_560186 [Nemania sp. FL0916]|nr:hypothetical protein F4777DRAFT_560186 [Nemania sp. FL0916]
MKFVGFITLAIALWRVAGLPVDDLTTDIVDVSSNHTLAARVIPINGDSFQYDGEECIWVRQFYPISATTCTEYCMAGKTGQQQRLRYHIMMTGNGQDPEIWCEYFKGRVQYRCGVPEPDFFNCNTGAAPFDAGLDTYAYDNWAGKTVTSHGVNLRVDFHGNWNADNNHECVAQTIKDITCRGVQQRLGLRCLPVNWRAAIDSDDEDETPVPPVGCLQDSEVPPSSR